MARWLIRRDSVREVTLLREHVERGVTVLFDCGSKRGLSDDQVVGWILDACVANPWDCVVLSDGTELPLQPPVKA